MVKQYKYKLSDRDRDKFIASLERPPSENLILIAAIAKLQKKGREGSK